MLGIKSTDEAEIKAGVERGRSEADRTKLLGTDSDEDGDRAGVGNSRVEVDKTESLCTNCSEDEYKASVDNGRAGTDETELLCVDSCEDEDKGDKTKVFCADSAVLVVCDVVVEETPTGVCVANEVDSNSVDEIGPFVASLSVTKVVVSLSELVGSLIEVKVCTLDGLICLMLVEVTVEDLTDTN